ncbi:MAG: hypothetical protein GTO54_00050 [Nitrososphaeria archaeon]|nr:hypothetical protein [Nitrososphaeria archaeon]
MAVDRSQQLGNMAANLPRQNQKQAAAGRQAANLAIKQAAAQAGPRAIATGQAQQMAGEATKALAQPELQAAQKTVQQQGQLARQELQAKQHTERTKEMKRRIGKMRQQTEFQDLLASIDNEAKNRFLDAEMKFQQDSFGRTKFTEQQLMDFAALQARDEVELQRYSDEIRRATENEIYMLNKANKLIEQEIQQTLAMSHAKRDHAYLADLKRRQHALKKKLKDKQAAKANRAMIAGAVLGTVGAVVGGYFGGPSGAAAGWSGGQGLGQAGSAMAEG